MLRVVAYNRRAGLRLSRRDRHLLIQNQFDPVLLPNDSRQPCCALPLSHSRLLQHPRVTTPATLTAARRAFNFVS